jgi:hypothetical protein
LAAIKRLEARFDAGDLASREAVAPVEKRAGQDAPGERNAKTKRASRNPMSNVSVVGVGDETSAEASLQPELLPPQHEPPQSHAFRVLV